jgi:hypothetical protein
MLPLLLYTSPSFRKLKPPTNHWRVVSEIRINYRIHPVVNQAEEASRPDDYLKQ